MSVEGLHAILNKETIVGTQSVERLRQAPQSVEEAYLHHVRSYVPLGRAAGGDEGAFTVADFEKKLIALVKEGKAPVGYVTAEYGYGKTSTCLYLWERCRAANLVAVPPFEFTELTQLVGATHAWVRYELSRVKPDLVARADEIRRRYEMCSLEELSREKNIPLETLRDLHERGQLTLTLASIVYVQFFEEMTALVEEAGFEGLVILPDELQQYLEPRIKSGVPEPLNPLFDVVQGMITRRGSLRCGLIFSIPARELAVINEQRGDFVQRLKSQGLGFDLRNVYSADFAARLWERLAAQFDFADERAAMVHHATLDAIGEIAARPDLASGPRTVIAIFQRIIARYLDAAGRHGPYTPIDLTDDYLAGAIPFDETGRIRQVVGARLAAGVVAGHAARERAVRLIAAFPTEGCPRTVLEEFSLTAAVDELAQLGQGTLAIFLGSTSDPGVTLLGLEPQSEGPRDWLTTTLREFGRLYEDGADLTMRRAVAALQRLLLDRIFTAPQWKVITTFERTLTQDRGRLLEGSFASTAKLYPQRTVFVRLLRADEEAVPELTRRHNGVSADFTIDLVLHTHFDRPLEERWGIAGALDLGDPRHPRMDVNLSHHQPHTQRPDLHNALQPAVNPYKVCPLLLLSLDEYLEEKRRNNAIPKTDDDLIKNTFQLSLADECVAELWNGDLVGPRGLTGAKTFEAIFLDACRRLFPDYKTLMVIPQWQTTLKNDYRRALGSLPSQQERQGELPVEGTKTEVAERLGRTNTALDNFIATFPTLLRVEQPFQGNKPGAVLFTLHPLESEIVQALKGSTKKINLPVPGLAAEFVPALDRSVVYALARERGYLDRESDEMLEIMHSRGLIEYGTQQHGGVVALAPRRVPPVGELAEAAEALLARFGALAGVYDDATIGNYCEQITKIVESLPALRRAPDEQVVMKLHATLRAYHNHLDRVLSDKRAGLRAELGGIALPQLPARRELDHLAQPVASALFGQHLDAVRKGLQQAFGQYEQQCVSLATNLEDLRAEAAGDVGAEDLAALTRRARALAGEIAKARTVGDRIGDANRAYTRALAVFNAAQLFQHSLERLGEVGAECKGEFDALIHDVKAAFGTRRERALDDVALWESRLTALQQRATELEQQQRARFEEWQEGYPKALNAHLDLLRVPAWRPQPFDPVHLEESRQRVREAAQRAVKEVLDEVVEACRVAPGALASIFHSGDIEILPDATRGDVIADAERCQALCGDVQQRMQALIQQVSERGAEIFSEPAAAFDAYCASVGQAQREARRLLDLLRRVEGALEDARLTEPEQTLLDAIQTLAVSGGRGVDLGLLLSSSGQTLATLLPLLGALYSKRKLYVTLEPNATWAPRVAPTVEERPVIPAAGVSE